MTLFMSILRVTLKSFHEAFGVCVCVCVCVCVIGGSPVQLTCVGEMSLPGHFL